MDNKHFLIEGEFLKKFGLLSIIEYSGNHNLSPDKIEDKGELIFRKSVTNQTVEYVSDIIVKIKDSFFIYLSSTDMDKNYKMKLFFEPKFLGQTKIFLKSLK